MLEKEGPGTALARNKGIAECNHGNYMIPYIGELPTFIYPEAIKNSLLALSDSVKNYVYILRRTDAINKEDKAPQPFYVGMGSGRRYVFHYYESATTAAYGIKCNRHKINIIRKIGRDNVLIQIIPCPSSEFSKALEMKLIAHWGRADNKTGFLTNLTDGGEGVSGLSMPEHVLDILRAKARQPIHFNGKLYDGIKVAFEAHTPKEISEAFQVDIDSGYCTDYRTFKTWYHNWTKQGFFPTGFNYIVDGKPEFLEISREEIQEQIRANRVEGHKKAWNTKYSYPRFVVKGNKYFTLSEAASREEVGTESNLAALFRRMLSKNIFYTGYNILDEEGRKLHQETEGGILEISRQRASEFLTAMTSKPIIVNGILYDNRLEAYNENSDLRKTTYESFSSQINRYEEAGVFPIGLNIPSEDGNPIYPEIDPFLLKGGPLNLYYKVCDRFFPSMQSASFFFGLGRTYVHNQFTAWEKQANNVTAPQPFPKGFNIYDSKKQEAIYPEMTIVDPRVPASGYLYHGKLFKKLNEIDNHRGSKRGVTSALYNKKRKAYFKSQKPFDGFLNVLALDGSPLYPIDLSLTLSTPIGRADGNGHRLHNSAKPVWILTNGQWSRFDSKSAAYRALPFLKDRYKNSDSFISSIYSQEKLGSLPEWLSYVEPQ